MKFLSSSRSSHHPLLVITTSFLLFSALQLSSLVHSGDVLEVLKQEGIDVSALKSAVGDGLASRAPVMGPELQQPFKLRSQDPQGSPQSPPPPENSADNAESLGRSWYSFKGDQDSGLNFHALITKRGFRLIEYSVDTEDGYQLALHRVVPLVGYSESNYTTGRKPILLAHDLIGSSANWFVNSPDLYPKGSGENGTAANGTDSSGGQGTTQAPGGDGGEGGGEGGGGNGTAPICGDNLGFCLILSGKWDVWALNFRGNAYSRRSKHYSTWNPAFWAFSQDQFAAYDIPANIKYVQEITGQKKVAFVGHEVSAAAMLALLSEHTEFTPETIDPIVLMAPSVYMANARSLLQFVLPYGTVALAAFPHEFQLQKLLSLLGLSACKGEAEFLSSGCKTAIEKLYGETEHFNATRYSTIVQFWPTSTSMDVIAHLAQHYLSNEFRHYKKVFSFGSSDPKAGEPYPLEQIHPKMRILIMTGTTDAWDDAKDSHRLIGRLHLALPHQIATFKVQNETWNHLDFIFGEDAGQLVYDPLMYYLENGDLGPYKPGNSSRWVVDANSTGGDLVAMTTAASTGTTPGGGGGLGGWFG